MKFKNLSIAKKMTVSSGIIILIVMVIGLRELFIVGHLGENTREVVESTEIADNIMEAKFCLRTEQLAIMELIEQDNLDDLKHINNSRTEIVNELFENLENGIIVSDDDGWGFEYDEFKHMLRDKLSEVKEGYVNDVRPKIDEVYEIKVKQIENYNDELLRIQYQDQIENIDAVADEMCVNLINEMQLLEEELEGEVLTQIINETESVQKASRYEVIITLFIALVLSTLLSMLITRMITKPIKDAVRMTELIAKGDLTTKSIIDQDDEIGQLLKYVETMSNKLKEIIGNVISGSDNISNASLQLNTVSQQISQGAAEQASSTEEVSASMEEMSSSVQQNNDNAVQTDSIAKIATGSAQEVKKASDESLTTIKLITEKITIINDIAFQTNILALNAAVEAARAGEQGKGFAVVAGEVRKLADSSKVAAEEILSLSNKGLETTEKSSNLLNQMIPEIEKTAVLIQEISSSCLEQRSGADQINNAMNQLSQITQQNAAASEEMATSSEELSSQAGQLKKIISYFKVDQRKSIIVTENTPKHKKPKVDLKPNKVVGKLNGIDIKLEEKGELASEYESF